MGYISDYRMTIKMPGDQENLIRKLLENRNYGIFSVNSGKNESYTPYFKSSCRIIDKGNDDNDGKTKYLCLSPVREYAEDLDRLHEYKKYFLRNYNSPSVEAVLASLRDKVLSFSTSYYGGGSGDNEHIINRDFIENILLLHDGNGEFRLSDEYFDIKIYLKAIQDTEPEHKYLRPVDIRHFNINSRILKLLERTSYKFDNDAMIAEYVAESDKIQAQYFVTKFHSNRSWDKDPVCIHVYRISAFLLPGIVPYGEVNELSKAKTAIHINDGTRYMVDSLHFNNDICFDLCEFKELIDHYHFIIAEA